MGFAAAAGSANFSSDGLHSAKAHALPARHTNAHVCAHVVKSTARRPDSKPAVLPPKMGDFDGEKASRKEAPPPPHGICPIELLSYVTPAHSWHLL